MIKMPQQSGVLHEGSRDPDRPQGRLFYQDLWLGDQAALCHLRDQAIAHLR